MQTNNFSKKEFFAKFCCYTRLVDFVLWFKKKSFTSTNYILCYHRINERETEGSKLDRGVIDANPSSFDKQIQFITANFKTGTTEKLASILNQDTTKNYVAITFDDGYEDNYINAYPILKKYNCPATIFLVTEFISKKKMLWWDIVTYCIKKIFSNSISYVNIDISNTKFTFRKDEDIDGVCSQIINRFKLLTNNDKLSEIDKIIKKAGIDHKILRDASPSLAWSQINEMNSDLVSYGAHTMTHPILNKMDYLEFVNEICISKQQIEYQLNKPINLFAYPNGSYDTIITDVVKSAGFKASFDYNDEACSCKKDIDIFKIPRISIDYDMSFEYFKTIFAFPSIMLKNNNKNDKIILNTNKWQTTTLSSNTITLLLLVYAQGGKRIKLLEILNRNPYVFSICKPFIKNISQSILTCSKGKILEDLSLDTFIEDYKNILNQYFNECISNKIDLLYKVTSRNVHIFSTASKNKFFIKLFHHQKSYWLAEDEFSNLTILNKQLSDKLKNSIPSSFYLGKINDYPVLITPFFAGTKNADQIELNNINSSTCDLDNYFTKVICWIAEFQNETTVSKVMVNELANDVQCKWQNFLDLTEPELPVKSKEIMYSIINEISNSNATIRISFAHKDFFPGNIIIQDQKIKVIDWAEMEQNSLPFSDFFDFFLSYSIIKNHMPPSNTLESFRIIMFESNEFSKLMIKKMVDFCDLLKIPTSLLKLLFPVYLLGNALVELQKKKVIHGRRTQKSVSKLQYFLIHYERCNLNLFTGRTP